MVQVVSALALPAACVHDEITPEPRVDALVTVRFRVWVRVTVRVRVRVKVRVRVRGRVSVKVMARIGSKLGLKSGSGIRPRNSHEISRSTSQEEATCHRIFTSE